MEIKHLIKKVSVALSLTICAMTVTAVLPTEFTPDFLTNGSISITASAVGSPANNTNTIVANSTDKTISLQPENKFYSPNKKYYVVFQDDGNLVVYENVYNNRSKDPWIWCSGTAGNNNAVCKMQNDGNLVIYNGNDPIWHTFTNEMRNAKLYISNEGDLFIYSADTNEYTFSTNTGIVANSTDKTISLEPEKHYYSPNRKYYVVFRKDGNLAVYSNVHNDQNLDKAVWNTGIQNNVGGTCKMRNSGNLVIYNSKGLIAWETPTSNTGKAALLLTNAGRLCIYSHTQKKYVYISDKEKLSIPSNNIQINRIDNEAISYEIGIRKAAPNEKSINTGFTSLGQNTLMLRRVNITAKIYTKMAEKDLRDNLEFTFEVTHGGQTRKVDSLNNYNIKDLGGDKYLLTEENVPCFGDQVNFGISSKSDEITLYQGFSFTSSDNDAAIYHVTCDNGENFHIAMDYQIMNSPRTIEKWLKTLSRYINSLSDITGINRKDIYISEYADTLVGNPQKKENCIPDGKPVVLIPSKTEPWNKSYQEIRESLSNGLDFIHLEYLHEVSHCYSIPNTVFHDTFNGNADDGNTNIRGITAMQNCKELEKTNLCIEYSIGSYKNAVRTLPNAKYSEGVDGANFQIMNMYANYVKKYENNNWGWKVLECYFAGGDQFSNSNLFSEAVQNSVKNALNKPNCSFTNYETKKFINAMQFLQQNAPDTTYSNPNTGMKRFIEDIVNKNYGALNYNDALINYIRKTEGKKWGT